MYNLFDYIDTNNIRQAKIEIRNYKKHNITNFNTGIRVFLNYTPLHSDVLTNNIYIYGRIIFKRKRRSYYKNIRNELSTQWYFYHYI